MPTLNQLQESYDRLRSYGAVAREFGMDRRGVARRLRAVVPKMEKRFRRYIVIPDLQVKDCVDLQHIDWIGQYITEKKPDVVVQLGDFADIPSLSSYDRGKKSFEGRRYKKDIEVAKREASKLMQYCKRADVSECHLLLGNHEHRIERATEIQPELDGLLSVSDLGYEEIGWSVHPFLQVVELDGICFSHYFVSGVMGRPITSAASLLTKKHTSCIAGHQQGKQIAYSNTADFRSLTAIISGSCYLHNEDYLGPQGNEHFRGLFMLNEVRDGQFDECVVSLGFLSRKYA